MRIAVLSPHRDDAAFSCGLNLYGALSAGAEVEIVNVFTRSDYAVDLRTVEPNLPQIDAISRARRLEDEAFIADLAAFAGREASSVRLLDLDLLDAPLRLTVQTERVLESPLTPAEVARQAAELAAQLRAVEEFDLVFAPLALGDHIDHRIVREAAGFCVAASRLALYEDLPYAGRIPPRERKEQTIHAMRSNPAHDFAPYALHLPDGPHLKRRFAMHYPSQIAAEVADEMASYAERGSQSGVGVERWYAQASVARQFADWLGAASVSCTLVEEQE